VTPDGADRPRWTVRGAEDLAAAASDLAVAARQLRSAVLVGDAQEAVRHEMLRFLSSEPTPLERTNVVGHLTGSALVVDPHSAQVVVLFHRKLRRWLQPGGHADGDADLARVAWREATEETGIDGLSVVEPPVHVDIHEVHPPDDRPHLHLDVRFVVLAPPGAALVGNEESDDLRWVDVAALTGLEADAGLLALASRGLEVLRDLEAAGPSTDDG